MIRVVGANPAMDRISTWPGLRLGEVNRAASVVVVPGGKGFNVARAAIRLGSPAAAYGFLGGPVGASLREMIRADGVIDRHTDIAAGTRVCFIVVEPDPGRATVLNEPGPAVTAEESARFTAMLAADCRAEDVLVLSGSLPDSLDPSLAAEVVAIGHAAGARTFVDIHGASLRAVVHERPWMLKCNRDELLGLLLDGSPTTPQLEQHQRRPLAEIAREMVVLRGRGIPVVVVTLGAQGALLADDGGVCHASVPEVDVANPTGSGDLLLAGLVVGLERGWTARQALVLGAACGTAGATHLLPELPPGFDAEAWMSRIGLSVLETPGVITLGVDVGTTRIKALALDVERRTTLALETAPTPVLRDTSGEAHRPGEVLDTVVSLLAKVAAGLPEPARVAALCCASVGEEVVLLDEERHSVGDAIAWYDPRGAVEAEAFLRGPGADLRLSRDFPPDATFSLFKLLWIRDHQPSLLSRATAWTDLGDFVLLGLGAELAMDWTHASRAGAFDLRARSWDGETIARAGLDLAFPPLVPSGTVVGSLSREMATRTGLSTALRLVTGGHDHLCAAYGAGLRTSGELFLSAGTSEAHLAPLPAPVLGRSADTGAYHVDQGCYVDAGSWYAHVNIHSGHVFRQWRALLYEGVDDARLYAELEASPAGQDGPVFDLLDDLRHARLDQLAYTDGRAEIMRAVLEGLARRSADIVTHLEGVVGRPFERILAVGLPTQVPLWRSLRGAAYGRPLAVVDEPEMTALGAALLAARAVAPEGTATA